jgi:hypothetical protein
MIDKEALSQLNEIVSSFGPSDDKKYYRMGKATPPIDQTKAIVLITRILNDLLSDV